MTLAPLVLTQSLITSSTRASTSHCSYCMYDSMIHFLPCPCAQNIAMCHILSWHIEWCGDLLFSSFIVIIYFWNHIEFTSCQVSCWCDYLSHLTACASCCLIPSSISPLLCARLYWLEWQFPALVLIFLVCVCQLVILWSTFCWLIWIPCPVRVIACVWPVLWRNPRFTSS